MSVLSAHFSYHLHPLHIPASLNPFSSSIPHGFATPLNTLHDAQIEEEEQEQQEQEQDQVQVQACPRGNPYPRRTKGPDQTQQYVLSAAYTLTSDSFLYGDLLLDFTLHSASLGDLLPLRGVNRYARAFVDRQIFKHVTLQTDTSVHDGTHIVPVITQTGQRLPVPVLTTWSLENVEKLVGYLNDYTTVLDLEHVPEYILTEMQVVILECFGGDYPRLSKLEVLRFKSDGDGFHTYTAEESFGADTVVVFPSFYPFLGWDEDLPGMPVPWVPNGVTKMVQHVALAVDWRGAILFDGDPGHSVDEEVWIMTHAAIDVSFNHFGLWDDRVHDMGDALEQELFRQIAHRLNDGINLTLVGLDVDTAVRICKLYCYDYDYEDITSFEGVVEAIRAILIGRLYHELSEPDLDKLHFKTWEEYAATLSPEQIELESLPPGVSIECIVGFVSDRNSILSAGVLSRQSGTRTLPAPSATLSTASIPLRAHDMWLR